MGALVDAARTHQCVRAASTRAPNALMRISLTVDRCAWRGGWENTAGCEGLLDGGVASVLQGILNTPAVGKGVNALLLPAAAAALAFTPPAACAAVPSLCSQATGPAPNYFQAWPTIGLLLSALRRVAHHMWAMARTARARPPLPRTFSTIWAHCVPLPAAGAPEIMTRSGRGGATASACGKCTPCVSCAWWQSQSGTRGSVLLTRTSTVRARTLHGAKALTR